MKRTILSFIFFLASTYVAHAQTSETLIQQADSLFWRGEYKKSEVLYTKAITFIDKNNTGTYFHAVQREAECLVREGLFERAEEKIAVALISCPADAIVSKAELLNTLGLCKIGKGAYEEAESTLDEAIQLTINKSSLSDALSDSYNNLSILFWTTGHNEKALSYALNALELRQKTHGNNSSLVAGSYMNLGLLYQHDKPEEALVYYDKAISIYEQQLGKNHPLIASALINKGIVYQSEKTYNSALTQFEKAATMIEGSVGNNHINYAFVLSHIGKVYLAKNNPTEAEQYEKRALSILLANFGERHPEVAQSYNELGIIKIEEQKYKEAIAYYQQALIANSFSFNNKNEKSNPLTSDFIHADLMLNSFLLKAQALEEKHLKKDLKIKDLTIALNTLKSADTLSENIRHRRTNKKDKVELGKITNDIYDQAVHLCLMLSEITFKKRAYIAQAFSFAEKNKAAVLLEAISDANAKSFAGLPDSLLEKELALKTNVSYLELMLSKAELEEDKKEWRSKLLTANRSYEDFIEQLEHDFPAYYELKYPKNSLSTKDLQSKLPESTAVFHYFISDKYNEVDLFMIDKQTVKVYRKEKIASLEKDLIGWRNTIRYQIEDKYIEIGNDISKQLLPNSFPNKKHIVIIPEGRLSATPFEALFTKTASIGEELPLVLKNSTISYNYSTSLYLESLKNSKLTCEKGNVLLCAPVTFQQKMADLPGTKEEVKNLENSFSSKGFSVTTQINEDANEATIKNNTDQSWSFIHFATHGLVNENDPDLSKILLHAQKDEDGDLFSGEIYNLDLQSELITLSACQTGLGKVTKGEGLIGLSRALLYAGGNNIIVSLWNVSDQATLILMSNLYENILNNTQCIDYSEALQKAKNQLIQNKDFEAPYYWAPFILIGH